jgi:hypothetical protein
MARFRSGTGLVGPGVAAGVIGAGDWVLIADTSMDCETEEGVTVEVLLFVLVLPFDDVDDSWLPA